MYKCDHCEYKSTSMWCINRHGLNRHGTNLKQQSTQHGVAAECTSNTLTPNNDLIKDVDSAHNWKNACEKVQHEKCADESWIKEQDAEILNLENQLQEVCNANKNWGEAYHLLEEHRREDGEHTVAITTYLQNVLNANNIRYNLDLA